MHEEDEYYKLVYEALVSYLLHKNINNSRCKEEWETKKKLLVEEIFAETGVEAMGKRVLLGMLFLYSPFFPLN